MSMAVAHPIPTREQPLFPLAIIAMGGGLTGFSGIFVRLSEAGPLATGGWRLAIAALALLPFLWLRQNRAEQRASWFSPLLILAGVFFAVDMGFFNWSLDFTSIAQATLIVNLAPIVALAAGCLMFGERFGTAKAIGLAAALGGAALMTLSRSDSGGTLAGNGMAALGMIGYAFYLIAVKRARGSHDTLSIMFGSSVAASVVMFAAAGVAGEQVLPMSAAGWAVLLALGLISHIFGQGLVAFGMREAPVGLASIILLTQPIVATLAAWAVFNEAMGPVEAGGAALVLTGLVTASRARG